ncbi:hypothetical protein OS493_031001 [Desmophyllum pertusum]|uniref:Uncharacterized protein n=1 Tax=Desmophyllum pertusum TaxID=174260 RepID=A0A9W9Z8A7_9CNID|nr:hypothetical protein OS493_031001 [Desmophyllum pertusum]
MFDFNSTTEVNDSQLHRHDLEIKSQKDSFEKESYAIKSDAEVKLAEIQALLESERDRYRIEIQNLKKENENLARTLFDERSQRRVLEGMHHASLEAAVLMRDRKSQAAKNERETATTERSGRREKAIVDDRTAHQRRIRESAGGREATLKAVKNSSARDLRNRSRKKNSASAS